MSTEVLSQLQYYKIGKTLRLDFNFVNRLYEANQKEYDARYNESNYIESLDKDFYFNNSLEVIEFINSDDLENIEKSNETINGLLRSIRYNSLSEIKNKKDEIKLNDLILRTDKKIILSEDLK
ncbi:MAG: hypothetical protein GTO02_07850 [Candidatus Dadabacteria bacterium]|nr:hypothetical protein [Candidatus Dadabacteria bacterium]